ncbi:MAG TPA: ATP-binding protein [Bordetella sp.]
MKSSLSTRLFLAMLALCALAILAMGFASYISFTQGFLGYLNEQAEERIDVILPRFEKAYAKAGSWDFLRGRPNVWFFMTRPQEGPPGEGPPEPNISDLTGAFLRVTLFDEMDNYVGGFRGYTKEQIMRPVMHDGHSVGWVGITPFESVSAAGGLRFQDSQLRSSVLIGIVCLLLAIVVAWRISLGVLKPVRSVAEATHRLAAGDYSIIAVPGQRNDEVGRMAADFNRMATQLASNERKRREFMADISHELRTPLAVLRGELEAMEDGIRSVSSDTLQSLQGEVAMMSKLVDDLFELSLAEIGGPTYRRDPVDLSDLLAQCMESFLPRLAARNISSLLEAPPGLQVRGDDRRLSQLFFNLLENSLRYTDPGGTVWWHATLEDQNVRIFCEDTAPGVPESQQERLFERFYRVEASRNRASGGAGLGLAICRGIVEVHGGTIKAGDSSLGGLCIEVRLPVLRTKAA